MERHEELLREAERRWEQEYGYDALLAGSAILAVLFPAFHFVYAAFLPHPPPDALALRFVVAAIAALVGGSAFLIRRLRPHAWWMHLLQGLPMIVIADMLVVDGGNDVTYVAGLYLIIFSQPLFYVRLSHLGVLYGVGFLFQLIYSSLRLGTPQNTVVLTTTAVAYVIAFAVAVAQNRAKRVEFALGAQAERLREEQIRLLQYRDRVTGLPNVDQLREALRDAVAVATGRGTRFGVLAIEVDPPQSARVDRRRDDAVLQEAARRITGSLPEDTVVFRGHGNAFIVLALGAATRQAADRIAATAIAAVATPFENIGVAQSVGATIGLALFPDDGADADTVLASCETALARTLRLRRGGAGFATDELDVALARAGQLAGELPRAIGGDELRLYYQPCVAADGTLIGVEALARWEHRELGTLLPHDFIELAEAEGLIVDLGDWVMREAARTSARWAAAGTPLPVAFNVSAHQFRDVTFLDRLRAAIDDAGADPRLLTLELTESTAMENSARAQAILDAVSALGLGIALDDFGTGYSSLSRLKHFPIDVVKIDRSFVEGLPEDKDDAAISRSILALAKALDCIVQAEGVETAEQAQWLDAAGCDRLQGFFYGVPMPRERFEAWRAAYRTEAAGAPR